MTRRGRTTVEQALPAVVALRRNRLIWSSKLKLRRVTLRFGGSENFDAIAAQVLGRIDSKVRRLDEVADFLKRQAVFHSRHADAHADGHRDISKNHRFATDRAADFFRDGCGS